MRVRLLLGCTIVLALGCGSGKFVPVSGRVTLNGNPVANAHVNFQPIHEKGVNDPGPGSNGQTNANGEFTLTTTTGDTGAVVGKHRVIISIGSGKSADDDSAPRHSGQPAGVKIPSRYGPKGKDALTFEVPAGGTNSANFPLKSP
jgi:hypothetical protein